MVPAHGAKQVVDLARVGAARQNDHLNLRVIDVQDAVEDWLDVVDHSLDEVLHVQVGVDRAAKRLELYRHLEQAPQDDRIGVAGDQWLVQLQLEAMFRFVVDEHLDNLARVIERADNFTIVEVPRIQLQVGDDVVHLEEEGVQGQRKEEAGQWVALVNAGCQREHMILVIQTAHLRVNNGNESSHARQLVDNRINGDLA